MDQNLPAASDSQKSPRRLRWLTGSIIVLIIAAAFWHFVLTDGPPPDDRRMIPEWTELDPAKPNPLVVFFGGLDAALLAEYAQLPENAQMRKPGSEAEVKAFIAKQQPNFVVFEKLLTTDPKLWQWPAGKRVASLGTPINDVSLCGNLAQVLRLKIHALMLEGRTEEASTLAMSLAHFGGAMLGAEGTLIHTLVGLTVQWVGEDALRDVLTKGSASPALLKECLHGLEHIGPASRADVQFAFKADYLTFKQSLQKMGFSGLAGAFGSAGGAAGLRDRFAQVLYKPNRTLAKLVELEQPLIEALDRNWKDAHAAAAAVQQFANHMKGAGLGKYFDSNFGGLSLLAISVNASVGIVERAMIGAMLHEQTRLMLALRLFELEKGKLPARLDELAPNYLASIPEDAFTGKPMIWDSVQQVLYSVGANGTDEKGAINQDSPRKGADLGMRYWWNMSTPSQAAVMKP